jgi:hypothetical protein
VLNYQQATYTYGEEEKLHELLTSQLNDDVRSATHSDSCICREVDPDTHHIGLEELRAGVEAVAKTKIPAMKPRTVAQSVA